MRWVKSGIWGLLINVVILLGAASSNGAIGAGSSNHMISPVIENLNRHRIVRSSFTQKKKLKILKKPLISTGYCIISLESGISWQILKPIPAAYLLNDSGIYEEKQGENIKVMDPKNSPTIKIFTSFFEEILKGDFNKIKQQFQIRFSGSPEKWEMELSPLSPMFKKAFKQVWLEGDSWIKQLRITEVNQTITEITFTSVQTNPSYLTDEEKKYFKY